MTPTIALKFNRNWRLITTRFWAAPGEFGVVISPAIALNPYRIYDILLSSSPDFYCYITGSKPYRSTSNETN